MRSKTIATLAVSALLPGLAFAQTTTPQNWTAATPPGC